MRDQRLHWQPLCLQGEHGHLMLSLKMGMRVFLVCFFLLLLLLGHGDQHCSPEPRGEAVWLGLTSIHSAPIAVT